MPKFKPILPDDDQVASLRRKLAELVRRMEADFERELKPLIVRMGENARKKASEAQQAAQKEMAKADAVLFYTAFEVARQLHLLKSVVIQDAQFGNIPGAHYHDGEWHIPEEAVRQYGIFKGKIDPDQDLLDRFHERLERLRRKYDSLLHAYKTMAEQFTEQMFRDSKKKFMKQFSKEVGVSMLSKLAERGLREAFDMEVAKNVGLIKSIPQKYFAEIQQMTVASVSGQRKFEGGLVQALVDLTSITKDRAKLIARDQSAKAVSTFSHLRAQNLGVIGYAWRTSKDKRVAGNPSGLYPDVPKNSKVHGDHWHREGVYFLFKQMSNPPIAPDGKPYHQPPLDGAPGIPLACRCWADVVLPEDLQD